MPEAACQDGAHTVPPVIKPGGLIWDVLGVMMGLQGPIITLCGSRLRAAFGCLRVCFGLLRFVNQHHGPLR